MESESILKDLNELLPKSILQEVACFCFYDNHPRDSRKIDIVVCTKRGEVMEFHQRELVSSLLLENTSDFIDIIILRNENCELFYFVHTSSQIIILSVKEEISIHILISNVERYEFLDIDFSGLPCLKVIRKEDAVPFIYDCNFKLLGPVKVPKLEFETFPIMSQLARKLTEAKYNVKQNQATLDEYIKIKQTAAYCLYERNTPNTEESFFTLGSTSISKVLSIHTQKPLVKGCNKKVTIIVNIKNENNVPIENIHILFHGTDNKTITYTTKLYEESNKIWKEIPHTIKSNQECFVLAVLDMRELKYSVSSKIEFEAVLSFTKLGSSYVLPLENISISVMETMREDFELLMSNEDSKLKVLGLMATSEKMELILRQVDMEEPAVNILEILCKHLNMEAVDNVENVLIHKKSPAHILHGLTLVLMEDNKMGSFKIDVYSRSTAQVLAFILYMYDRIPHRIMATLPDHIVSAKTSDLARFNSNTEMLIDTKNYASSLLNISKQILEYFDECMIKMNNSTEPEIIAQIGKQINLLSVGLPEFLKFRNKVIEESSNGVQTLKMETFSEDMSIECLDV
ncbi:uncharacterized protein LOC111000662 [Pieris rapae]|uniref:uncharacterized protein LOC111000662 n=1 Tax=Pieris rapae TaxID=64459 RepID=UPI001E27B38E|nr:uncharacterized protein LOC111000662 [Pieris rapae]